MGKFPTQVTHTDNLQAKCDEVKATIKFQMKKVRNNVWPSSYCSVLQLVVRDKMQVFLRCTAFFRYWLVGLTRLAFMFALLGLVLGCCHRTHRDGRGRAGRQHLPCRQLPRLAAEEELAERPRPLPQEHHGQAPASVLDFLSGDNKCCCYGMLTCLPTCLWAVFWLVCFECTVGKDCYRKQGVGGLAQPRNKLAITGLRWMWDANFDWSYSEAFAVNMAGQVSWRTSTQGLKTSGTWALCPRACCFAWHGASL